MSDYWKKKLDELNKSNAKSSPAGNYWDKKMSDLKESEKRIDREIAPVKTVTKATTKKEEKEEDDRKWFQKGAFEDGYQFGDVTKSILGTLTDTSENLATGVIGMGEKVVDAGAYAVGGLGKLFQADDFVDRTEKFISKDLYDEKNIAKKIVQSDRIERVTGVDSDDSIFGEKTDSLMQSAGELGGTIALQAVGVPWFVTTGLTSFGGEVENAFNQGASYGEAGLSSAITMGAEILTEKISGGISFGGKTLDDALTKRIARGISNKTVRTLTKLGVDMAGEGAEEVLSGTMSAIGQKITYADDKELTELFSKEDALESFIGGAVLGGGMSGIHAAKSVKRGVDYASGLTENEQKVIDKEYENRVAEQEKDGEKLTKQEKDKIYDAVVSDMEKGYISTDTIEEVLGGDTFKSYQNTVKNEDSLRETFTQLNQMKQGEMTGEQIDLRNDLKEQLKELESKGERNTLKSRLSEEVMGLVQNDRLSESYNERARRGQAYEADLTKYDQKQQAVIQKAVDSGILNNTRRTHEFVDMVAKISADKGVLFDFTNNEKLKDTSFAVEGKTVNGFVTKDGVTLNIDSAKSLNSVVGHEITHVLEGTDLYAELQTAVMQYAKSKGEYQGRYDSLSETYKSIEDANIDGELTADLIGDYLFTDPDFINNLSTNNRNVFQKIYDEIKYLCKVATAGSKEARELEKVKRAFEKAYREGGKQSEEAKYSVSDSNGKQLTSEQQEYFKDSKARDDDGNLKVVYHSSPTAGFTVFDGGEGKGNYKFGEYGDSITFFTDNKAMADSYSPSNEKVDTKKLNNLAEAKDWLNSLGFTDFEIQENNGRYDLVDPDEELVFDFEDEADLLRNLKRTVQEEYGDLYAGGQYEGYLNMKNPLVVDAEGRPWDKITEEFSQEIYDKFQSLTAEEKAALTDLAGWEDGSLFAREVRSALNSVKNGKADNYTKNLASAFDKLKNEDGYVNLFNLYDIAADNFTDEAIRESATVTLSTNDYVERALQDGSYDGVIIKNVIDYGAHAHSTLSSPPGNDYIVFNSNQFKAADNLKPTEDADIRYSLSGDDRVFYTPRGIEVVQNPSDAEYRQMRAEIYKEYPWLRGTGEAILRHTYDESGNEYYWNAFDGMHMDVEPYINKQYNTRTSQHWQWWTKEDKDDYPTDYSRVRYSLSDTEGRELSAEQQDFFRNAKTRDEQGRLKPFYHGTGRADRVGNVFRPDRATSGPFAMFTDNRRIADNYARDKADTSLAYDEMYDDYYTQFRIEVNGKNMSVSEAWKHLPMSKRMEIREKAKHVTMDDDYENVIYDEDAQNGVGGFDSYTINQHKGNILEALTDVWLESGTIYGEEQMFLDVLKLVGLDDVQYMNPDARTEKTYEVYLNITNPFDTSDISEEMLEAFREAAANTEFVEGNSADSWDKRNIHPEHWIERLESDIENGTYHVWTSIPDFVTDVLKAKGYDGIFDTGGKGGGEGHTVAIPFYSEQVKNVDNQNPTSDPDIRRSVSGRERRAYGSYNVYGKDIALETVSETESVKEAAPVAEPVTQYSVDEMFPDDLAPAEYNPEQFNSLEDADAPPEMEAPYYGEESVDDVEVEDPFEERDWHDVGNQKVKAYMYENPEVKPFFQAEAKVMLGELRDTTKGERWYNDKLYYDSGGEEGFGGTKRHTSADIAYLLDEGGFTYAEIEKGLNAIIEDNGAENIAAAKRIEFILNDRLMNGYQDFWTDYVNPPDQDYLKLLNEKQITEYSQEAFDIFMEEADKYAPPISEEIAPVAMKRESNPTVAIKPKREKQPRLARATPEEQARAEILVEEPEVSNKKRGLWSRAKELVFDKGMVFENLSLKTGNDEVQARFHSIRNAETKAQRRMDKALKPIVEKVNQSGKTKGFYEYLYHQLNVDRMTLESRYDDTPNKPVFGNGVTAKMSQEAANKLEKANPEFKQWAQEVYDYMNDLREQMVDGGVISEETANLWAEMYPHYVPIRRVGDTGLNINVPLDTGRTGINAPIKRATGGSRDILPLFDTMGQRTMQTYKAIAKNRFGVELKNTLGTTIADEDMSIDEAIDGVDAHEELLQEGKNGQKPTFTVFEDGKKVTFEITDEMYSAMKPTSETLAYTNKPLNVANNIRRGLLTEYNPTFLLTNAIKDTQDVVVNSKHPARTYASYPKAISELIGKKGRWYQEYMDNGGERLTYFDKDTNTFTKEKSTLRKVVGFPLDKIGDANNFIERIPRLAEYIASREMGRSIDVSMLDAARVTTNFQAGGDLTKMLNRNGFTFLNASVQGAVQQVRNVREAKANGLKGWAGLAAKIALAGLPSMLLNHLMWDDDEEYAELSDYVKQNYYIVGKYGDGKFVRIPKGRALAVIQNAFEQMEHTMTGDDEADWRTFGELVISNLAPNNPLENNIFAPLAQAYQNQTWYGDDLVPTRLQDLPAAEQYDETTDEISKWLGEKTNISPYKLNYLLDQYSGGLGDVVLPRLTLEAERGDNSMIAPLADKFTTDSVMKNQKVSDFYDTKDKLTTNAKSSKATEEDILMSKYMNSINSELSELYAEKREIQNSDLSDEEKYNAVRDVQKQIVSLTRESLMSYEDISYNSARDGDYANIGDRYFKLDDDGEWQKLSEDQVTKYKVTSAAGNSRYATDGTNHYRWYEPGEDAGEDAEPGWRKVTDKELERQKEVTRGLGISPEKYWGNKEEYSYAYEHPESYAVAKAVGGYDSYRSYSSELYDIKADKDSNGKSISGSRKEKVLDYINGLDIDYGARIILFKNEYNADDTYNYDIIEYLNGRDDISGEEMVTILKKLGFTVSSNGNISW